MSIEVSLEWLQEIGQHIEVCGRCNESMPHFGKTQLNFIKELAISALDKVACLYMLKPQSSQTVMIQIHSFLMRALAAFLLTATPGFAFMLSADFSKDTPGGSPEGAELFDLNEGRIIKVVDASTEPEDPFDVKGNKSLLFEKNSEGSGGIPRAEWGNIPDIEEGKLTFTALSVKEAAGIFDNPVFFAHLISKGKIIFGAGFGGSSIILMDGDDKVVIPGAWPHNVPNKMEITFSTASQTYSVYVNGEKLKSNDGREEFKFKNIPPSGGIDKLRFSVAELGNTKTQVFLDNFELTDKSEKTN